MNSHLPVNKSQKLMAMNPEGDGQVLTETKTEVKEPAQYHVLMHNDDFTPMDFVVGLLQDVFHMDEQKSKLVMIEIHQKGLGYCGVFPFDLAETKVHQVLELARKNQYPLKCTIEKI